jgi:DNA-binding transcriptional ArsR family regulator
MREAPTAFRSGPVEHCADACLRALVGAARAAVLKALLEPQTTLTLAATLHLAPSTVSQHLSALVRTGLVERRRDGRCVYYALNERGHVLLALFESS